MALQPITQLTQSSDCTQLTLTDVTGSYNAVSNAGGYGSPNVNTSNVTSITISGTIYLPAGTTVTIPSNTLFPTATTPTFNLYQAWILTTALFSISGNTFQDGIYSLTYTVNSSLGGGSNYTNTYTWQQLITCNADCCIGNALSAINPCDCDSDDVYEMFGILQAAKAASGATMNSKALDLLNTVTQWCNKQSQCGCN